MKLVSSILITTSFFSCKQTEKKPNILLIITDQQHAGMMSCTGNPWLQTPAMDHLASNGVRFELAFSPNPVSVPSRTSMMTGHYSSAFGFEDNIGAFSAKVPQYVTDHTIGNVFQRAEYQTAYGGKTHWDWTIGLNIENSGFEYLTADERDELAEKCASFLKRKHEKPFFLIASFINPHDICYVVSDSFSKHYQTPLLNPDNKTERGKNAHAVQLANTAKKEGLFDSLCPPLMQNFNITSNEPEMIMMKYSGQQPSIFEYVRKEWSHDNWRLHRWIYHRLTEDVDRQIGIVLDALKETGLDKNTIIVFTSDHGEMDGAHQLVAKSFFYEESVRVPFIISGPGIARNVNDKHLVSASLDLFPTLCDFAGIDPPDGLPGLSLKPIVFGNTPEKWRDHIFSESERGRMVRNKKYKYCIYKQGNPRELLIDLENDPGEMNNLAVDPGYKEVLKENRLIMRNWLEENGDTLIYKYLL